MASSATRVAWVGGIVAFCACLLAGLLQQCMPLTAAKRAAVAAIIFAVMAWLCARVALNVIGVGLKNSREENKP